MSESLQSVIEAISSPLDVYKPAQRDERYLDLRAELDKLSSPAGGDVDWQRVLGLGASVLREVGKDLLVCAYSMSALYELHGVAGSALGIRALAGLMRSQAEHLGPRKAGSRANALRWFLERLKGSLARTVEASEGPALVYLKERVAELRAASTEHLGERSPAFGPLLEVIESQLMTLPAEALLKPFVNPLGTEVKGETLDSSDSSSSSSSSSSEPAEILVAEEQPGVLSMDPWLAPIEGPDACGEDPRKHHEEYSLARTELQKGDAVVEGVEVDWRRVYDLADGLLREKSKDLQVGCWFAISGLHCRGFDGLVLGLGVVAELVRAYPEIHPRRARSRRNSARWLVGEVTRVLKTADIKELAPRLESLRSVCTQLTDALRERLGDDAPAARPLRDVFSQIDADLAEIKKGTSKDSAADESAEEHRRDEPPSAASSPAPAPPSVEGPSSSPAPAPVPPSVEGPSSKSSSPAESGSVAAGESVPPPAPLAVPTSTPAPAPASAVAVALSIAEPANLVEVEKFLTSTGRALVSTASSLRESTPAEPRSYRLLRAGLWLHLRAPPPTRADGNTGLPSLDELSRQKLAEFAAAGQWKGLLHRSENLLRNHRLVLDLNRFTADALRALGSDYEAAALEVRTELRALLTRFPSLPDLRASDGSPLADASTQRWILKEVLPRAKAVSSAGSSSGVAGEQDADTAEFWASLSQRLQGDEKSSALSEAQSKVSTAPSGQLRFVLALRLAEATAEAETFDLAEALFAGLAREAASLGLARWQPGLAVRCLAGLVRAQHHQGRSYARPLSGLSLLDPAGAAGLLDELGVAQS